MAGQGIGFAQFKHYLYFHDIHPDAYYLFRHEIGPEEACNWLKKGAENGYPPAEVRLAVLLYEGGGSQKNCHLKRDVSRAYKLAKGAAESNHALAQYMAAYMVLNGKGDKRDKSRVASWLRSSAQQGYGKAMELLKEIGSEFHQSFD